MGIEAYRSIDVDVFKEILENKTLIGSSDEVPDLIDLVKKIQTVELRIPEIDLNHKKETKNIKHKSYGFHAKADFKVEFRQDVFENETIITLIPQKVYKLDDVIKRMPIPYCEKGKKLSMLLGDAFERLKVKAKNILQNTASDVQITHYAKKNIQVALRNCYDARMCLVKIQKTKNRDAIFMVVMANVFTINVLSYLYKMFSSYYTDTKNQKDRQKAELYDIMDLNVIMEPEAEYKRRTEIKEEDSILKYPELKLNVPTNQFLTVVYDIITCKIEEDLTIIEGDKKEIEEMISNVFLDRKGKPLKKSTINTYLKTSRDDKRVTGSKRNDVLTYFVPKKP